MSAESETEILKEIREMRAENQEIFRMFRELKEVEERREQRWLDAVGENRGLNLRIDGLSTRLGLVEARVDKLEGKGKQ
jgi:hypothetical protein